jgi:hypothetical protein
MKKSILFASSFITICGFAQKQFPNKGFESWETIQYETTSYVEAEGWASELCASIGDQAECVVSGVQTTDKASGDYALKIDGFAVLGDVAITGKPTSLEFKAKTNLPTGEFPTTASISVLFHDGSFWEEPTTRAQGEVSISETTSGFVTYTMQFSPSLSSVSFAYATIVVSIDGDAEGAFVILDDLELKYGPNGIASKIEKTDLVYPTHVSATLTINEALDSYQILDLSGNLIAEGNAQEVNISDVKAGIYVVKVITQEGLNYTSRIVKE